MHKCVKWVLFDSSKQTALSLLCTSEHPLVSEVHGDMGTSPSSVSSTVTYRILQGKHMVEKGSLTSLQAVETGQHLT